ncbi:MAG: HNH endonuclease [Patescibacteria group bacterium]|nr:HNH endonuclease [Patescibacteria group bacterium]
MMRSVMVTLLVSLIMIPIVCVANDPILPNHTLTPGATLQVTKTQVCVKGYSTKVRDVPESEKKQVFTEYHIDWSQHSGYEVDHLISLELGGSNDIKNLWPQSYTTKPYNAHVKDRLEDRLHSMVCKGQMSLVTAQKSISTNWVRAYLAIAWGK